MTAMGLPLVTRLVRTGPGPLPPGPRLPRFLQSVLFLKYRETSLPAWRRKFGNVFTLHVPLYSQDVVVFSGPQAVTEIFRADPRQLHAGEGNQILGLVTGPNSVILADEDAHRRLRSLIMPAFNGAALRGYRSMIADAARAEVTSWNPDEKIAMLPAMKRLTLDIIITAVFGVTDLKIKAELVDRLAAILDIQIVKFVGLRIPLLRRIQPWKGFLDNQARVDEILYREIRSRRADPELGQRDDVMSRLVRTRDDTEEPLTDAELRDQLISLLLGGHETTAATLAWALWELARHPELQAKARAAAVSGDDKYLEAVFKEAMRRHTVIGTTARKLAEPLAIDGHQLPGGTCVNAAISLSHSDPQNHPQPNEFRPERFLGTNPPSNTWYPFGGGVRRCPGAGFALASGTVIISEILTRWELTAEKDNEQPTLHNITAVPRHQAVVRLAATNLIESS